MKKLLAFALLVYPVLIPSLAGAYEVRKSRTGTPLRWAEGRIDVELSLDSGPAGAPEAATLAFVTYASAIRRMTPEIEIAVQVRHGDAPAADGDDGTTTVRWMEQAGSDDYDPDALAVTVTSYAPSGRITDADILLNPKYTWITGKQPCDRAYDMQSVITHEIGHLFGLAHDPQNLDATMYPTAGMCETIKRDLAESDEAGLSYLYEVLGPAPGGCSVAGHGRGGMSALLLLGGTALLVLHRRRALLALALCGLAAGSAGATTMRRMPLDAAGKSSAMVARGTVSSVEVRRVGARIYTDATMTVAECMKGDCGKALVIRQLGGELEGEGTVVEGSASFATGDEVVVFLRARRDGTHAPVGMAQGVLRVVRGAAKKDVTLVRDLRGLDLVGEKRGGLERLTMEELAATLAR